jgi:hypothetical protein
MAFGITEIPPFEPPTYKLFISHAWNRAEYDSLVDLIRQDMSFLWENLSVPKENPIAMLLALPKSIRTLVHELDDRIRQADCVLIISGMYVAHRQWIQSEIEAALDFRRPIVGVAPRGQDRIPEAARLAIEQAGGELVRWNKGSIVSAIRRRAGLEPPTLEIPGVSLSSLVGNPVPRTTVPPSAASILGNPSSRQPGSLPLSALIDNITKGWPRK